MRADQRVWNAFARFCLVVAVLFCMSTGTALAGEGNIYAAIENFTWKEFDDAGAQLLKESGMRGGIGYAYHAQLANGMTLRPKIELNWGQVDYDGADQTGTPVLSDTNYFGVKLEFDLGGRIGSGFIVEPFGGLGVRTWWRDINDSFNILGSYVTGYTEEWTSLYGRAGLRAEAVLSKTASLFFEGVAKLPLYAENYIDDEVFYQPLTLEPDEKISFFAEAGFKINVFKLSAYYESMRFDKSPVVYQYDPFLGIIVGYLQPKSDADMYGIKIGAAF